MGQLNPISGIGRAAVTDESVTENIVYIGPDFCHLLKHGHRYFLAVAVHCGDCQINSECIKYDEMR